MTTVHRTRRRLRIDEPLDQDAKIIVILEYHWDEDLDGNYIEDTGRTLLLTNDGWKSVAGHQTYDRDELPYVSGLDLVADATATSALLEKIRELIGPEYREEPTTTGETSDSKEIHDN